ncbi:MAG TPA: alpha/beta hydrolase-fold protein, partial [Longimicrobium sp.]|nr:alpha/beta hydrolase-fold protein [Longimicrobium sp.]
MRAVFLVLALLLSVPGDADAQRRETGFLFRTLALGDSTYRYQVYVPPEYTPRRRWPVILFLHGAGERGTDGLAQTQVGLPAAIRRGVERWPAIVVIPQARPEQSWTGEMERLALSALARTEREYHTDPARVYLTGLSMGGYGTWSIAARHPGRFAALLVVCGGVHPPAR